MEEILVTIPFFDVQKFIVLFPIMKIGPPAINWRSYKNAYISDYEKNPINFSLLNLFCVFQ